MQQKYRLGFKKMACELNEKYQNHPSIVAAELSIPIKTYEKWLKIYRKNPYAFNEQKISFEDENRALRKQLKEREETIEILKKTFAFFTKKKKSLQVS